MEAVSRDYLGKHKKFRTDSKKLAIVFFIMAVLVAVVVFWWLKLVGITATGEALCGIDEHTHDEECYISELVCGMEADIPLITEAQTSADATDEAEAPDTSVQTHTHTDSCYKKTLACTKPEHIHTVDCFPDKTADVETVGDWLETLDDVKLTNNIPENLIAVAMTQMEYAESDKNFEFDDNGTPNGYTRYGEWYGNPYGKWNTMFVAFCLHYSNINNDSELKKAGADAMRLAWQNRRAYAPADEYTPQRGDLVFTDTDDDSIADTVGIILSADAASLVVILGDSNERVEITSISSDSDIIGYGQTGKLSFAKDMEYKAAADEPLITDGDASSEAQSNTAIKAPLMMFAASPKANITYITDLETAVSKVAIKTQEGVEIGPNDTIYIGQNYTVAITFSETNTGSEWTQFEHQNEPLLTYQLPSNLQCEPFDSWHTITTETENGTIENVGEYFIGEDGQLLVRFLNDKNGESLASKYSNAAFTIEFDAQVTATQSGTSTEIEFNDKINVNLNVDGGADYTIAKTHGEYNSDDHTVDYTLHVEATKGVVKDFVLVDQIWENHHALRDTIVVTDLDGNVLDPQPTISNPTADLSNPEKGFVLSGFPDFSAGNGFLITYKSQIDDNQLSNENVSMWNSLSTTGNNSKGEKIPKYTQDWLRVELEKMEKNGKQSVLTGPNGEAIPVIEWEVEIKKDNHNLQGTVIIDTLGEGLAYYTGQPIRIKHYDEWGNRLEDAYINWNDVTINGDTMSFALPDGYSFVIVYYTTYEDLDEGEQKNYTNSVTATINGKEETAGGDANVVGFVPRVSKNASGNDGEFVNFTIEAQVPAVIKDWGGFLLTDHAAFWGYKENDEGYLYVENAPQDMVITAVTESGRTVTFTPYVPGGPTENTYILVFPAEGNQYHSFNVFFNTSAANTTDSKWILDENAVLTVSYKIPFDASTGVEWEGPLQGDKTLEDVLLEGYKMANEAYLNYTQIIQGVDSTNYEYAPQITKKGILHEDGTIDYTVVFNNTIPGTGGNGGYLVSAYPITFNDTFDEKLEYVANSLEVTCYDPWNDAVWYNKYVYDGEVSGNTMSIPANQFSLSQTNPALPSGTVSWIRPFTDYQKYCNQIGAGGKHVFTYKLKVKDEYLYSTEENIFELDNTAELTWNTDNTSGPATEEVEYKTGLLDKHAVQKDSKLDFDIHINRHALDILPGVDRLTIQDTMTENLSVYWDSIKLYYEDANGNWIDFNSADSAYSYTVTYDQTTNNLTFVVPDELHIRIDYSTLITQTGLVSVNNSVKIDGKAEVSDLFDAQFRVQEHSGGATGSNHSSTLIKQDGDTNHRLPNVTFHLYGPMGDPHSTPPAGHPESIVTENDEHLHYIGTWTTGADGTVEIETQYLTIGGPYALVEEAAPPGYQPLQHPVYFYFYEPDPDGIIQTVTTLIAVENYTYGFVLPETGSSTPLFVTIIGFALVAAPVLYSTIRRKRERRLT